MPVATDQKVRTRRVLERGESSAAPRCSNQTDLRLTLADLFYGSDLPERPSSTSTDLVCIQKARGSSPLSSTGQRPYAILKAPKQSQTKTEKSRRTLALPQNAVTALREHRKWQAEARLAAGPLWQDTGLVFTTSVGTPLDASHVRRDFRALCKKAGIEGIWAPRELRHTFVSVMSVSGVAVEEIARLTGHASSRTTETVYRHELRPVITTGADVTDKVFTATQPDG